MAAFNFLELPFSIRREVYLNLGLPQGEQVSLNQMPGDVALEILGTRPGYDGIRSLCRGCDEHDDLLDGMDDRHFTIRSLLGASKALDREIRSIFFSGNSFTVHIRRWGSLKPLEDIGPSAWRELRELTVRFQPCSCATPHCTDTGWLDDNTRLGSLSDWHEFISGDLENYYEHGRWMDEGKEDDAVALRQWEAFCKGLGTTGEPGRLKVMVGGAVRDLEMGRRILKPLYLLPAPRDVGITFGRVSGWWSELRDLAMQTVVDLVEQPRHDRGPFRFMDLPEELQHIVLGYTQIGEATTLRWWPPGPDRVQVADSPCWHATDPRCGPEPPSCYPTPRYIFCRKDAAAYHRRCGDFPPTLSWLRVSRRFGELVKRLYFYNTTFEVLAWGTAAQARRVLSNMPLRDADTDPGRGVALFRDFLQQHAGTGSLRHMTKLSLVFPPIFGTYLTLAKEAWAIWLECIEILAGQADLPALELTICLARHRGILGPHEKTRGAWEACCAKVEGRWRFEEGFARIVEPLRRLGALKRFFVHVPWPGGSEIWAVEARKGMARRLEREVMGDEYNTGALGKPLDCYWTDAREMMKFPGFSEEAVRWAASNPAATGE